MQVNKFCNSVTVPAQTAATGRSRGVGRRDFLALCGAVSAMLGLGPGGVRKVQAALAAGLRQPVLWLHFAECTGCSESLLRSTSPYFDDLILNTISLDYHETLMVEAGQGAEALRQQVLSKYAGDFLCVVEGSIPTAGNGSYGTIGSRTMYAIAEEVLPKAKAIIAIGSCSCDGGVAAAAPNPASVRSVADAFPSLKVPVIKCPGCPPNPVNFVAILADYLLKGTTPALDSSGRPTFAYGKTVHQQCTLLGTANCLQSQGCRGISTFHNCPKVKYNQGTSFCQQAGHVCIACSESGFWDAGAYWDSAFWKKYTVSVDPAKSGISYAGNPNGIVSTKAGPADAGVGGAGGRDAGNGGSTGSGGAGSGGTAGSAGDAGRGGAGGAAGSGGSDVGVGGRAGGGGSTSGGSAGSGTGGSLGSGGLAGTGGRSGLGGGAGSGSLASGGSAGLGGSGGTAGAGGATSAPVSSSAGCGCDVGGASQPGLLGSIGTLAAAGLVAARFVRQAVASTTDPKNEGEACPASSSTPSRESKDT
jgi:[NiFe] hydrogenase small subunit